MMFYTLFLSLFACTTSSTVGDTGGGMDIEGGHGRGERRERKERTPPTCRVCNQTFATFPELKQHCKTEGHWSKGPQSAAGGDVGARVHSPDGMAMDNRSSSPHKGQDEGGQQNTSTSTAYA